MNSWILLPYDGSPVARAALRRAACLMGSSPSHARRAGVILATAGVDPSALTGLLSEAQATAGPNTSLEMRLLAPGDPVGDFRHLVATLPYVTVAAPMGAAGWAPWYTEACRIGGLDRATMLFFVKPRDLEEFEEVVHVRPGVGRTLSALLRAGARLCAGQPAAVAGGSR